MPKELTFVVTIVIEEEVDALEAAEVQENIIDALMSQIDNSETGLAPEGKLTKSVAVVGTSSPFKSTISSDKRGGLTVKRTYL